MNVTVHSVIDSLSDTGLPTGDPEINIFTVPCELSISDGALTLSYTENTESGEVGVTLTVKESGSVLLERRGAVEWNILFEEGKSVNTLYKIPPYSFDVSVHTKKIRSDLSISGGELQLIYSMNIGGDDRRVRMKMRV